MKIYSIVLCLFLLFLFGCGKGDINMENGINPKKEQRDQKPDERGEHRLVHVDKIMESILPHMLSAFGKDMHCHLIGLKENDIIAVTKPSEVRLIKILDEKTYCVDEHGTRLMTKEDADEFAIGANMQGGTVGYYQILTVAPAISSFANEIKSLEALKKGNVIFGNSHFVINSVYYNSNFCKVLWPYGREKLVLTEKTKEKK